MKYKLNCELRNWQQLSFAKCVERRVWSAILEIILSLIIWKEYQFHVSTVNRSLAQEIIWGGTKVDFINKSFSWHLCRQLPKHQGPNLFAFLLTQLIFFEIVNEEKVTLNFGTKEQRGWNPLVVRWILLGEYFSALLGNIFPLLGNGRNFGSPANL